MRRIAEDLKSCHDIFKGRTYRSKASTAENQAGLRAWHRHLVGMSAISRSLARQRKEQP